MSDEIEDIQAAVVCGERLPLDPSWCPCDECTDNAFRSGGQTYQTGPRPTLTTPQPSVDVYPQTRRHT
jgi:hypothetical protein